MNSRDLTDRHSPYGPQWEARQKALKLDTGEDWLKPDEIDCLERFQDLEPDIPLAVKITWISRDEDAFLPTDDFEWTANGCVHVEMKRVYRADYSAIHDAINGTVKRLKRTHPGMTGVKESFMVFLGGRKVTDGLRIKLEDYNIKNPSNPIKQLWLVWDGHLEKIDLG